MIDSNTISHYCDYYLEQLLSRISADQGLLDQVAEDEALALVVDDLVAHVDLVVLEDVEDRQQLPVVGHQRLACRPRASSQTRRGRPRARNPPRAGA